MVRDGSGLDLYKSRSCDFMQRREAEQNKTKQKSLVEDVTEEAGGSSRGVSTAGSKTRSLLLQPQEGSWEELVSSQV